MTSHYDDEAQVEEVRRWLKENWFALAAGLALGFAVIFGQKAWVAHRDVQRMTASQLFEDLNTALEQHRSGPDVDNMGKRLIGEFADTPYAADAQLALAQAAVADGRLFEAQGRLQWVIDYESKRSVGDWLARWLPSQVIGMSRDPALGDLARLRLARVLWEMGKSEDALALTRTTHDPAFDGLYLELRGDVLLSKGDRGGAKSAFQDALQASAEDASNRRGLQEKIQSLADAGGSAS